VIKKKFHTLFVNIPKIQNNKFCNYKQFEKMYIEKHWFMLIDYIFLVFKSHRIYIIKLLDLLWIKRLIEIESLLLVAYNLKINVMNYKHAHNIQIRCTGNKQKKIQQLTTLNEKFWCMLLPRAILHKF